jgi:hypothetical protein
MDIKLTPVKSSTITGIGYDPKSQIMAVKFKSGSTYHYSGVPAAAHQSLVSAKSIGKHFGVAFRGMKFERK